MRGHHPVNCRHLILGVLLAAPLCAQTAEDRQLDRLSRWLRSPRESIRHQAVNELELLPGSQAVPLLLSALSDTSTVVRAAAVTALARLPDPRTGPALRPLLQDDDERVRAAVVWTMSHTAGKTSLPDILPLCRDDASGLVRFRAVWGLAIIGDKSALPVAVAALGDFNPAVRERAALLALEALADDTLGERLAKQAGNEFAPTRRIVMYLLGRYGDGKQAGPVLREGLADREPLVRAEAALALGKRRARNSLPALVPALKDEDEHVRGAAAYAVGLLEDQSGRDALRPLLQDEAAFVRAVAAESLQRLGEKIAKPPPGFRAVELFTYPIHSPEHAQLYR